MSAGDAGAGARLGARRKVTGRRHSVLGRRMANVGDARYCSAGYWGEGAGVVWLGK